MQKYFSLLLLSTLVLTSAFAQSKRSIGEVRVDVDANTIPVRVSANSAELQNLALIAFDAHGRYKRVASGHAYDIKFSAAGTNQVRVDITRGASASAVASQVVSGSSARNALLRAADFAVEKTNGLGLKGFFTDRIAFVVQRGNKGEIYTSDLFLGEARQLTRDNSLVLMPRWSPDGSRVLYTSYFKTGAPDIYVHDVATGRREIFANWQGMNSGARFSPSGQQVAMVLSGKTGVTEIYVSDAQGRRPERKTKADSAKSSPVWSPDGRQILFAMDPGPQLYRMSVSGGAPQRVSIGLGTYAAEPDWSRAKPNLIACTVRVGTRYQIAVYDMTTGKGKVVSKADFDAIEPSWLGDGRHLVYTARDRTTSVISILDTETGKSSRISPADSFALQANVWIAP